MAGNNDEENDMPSDGGHGSVRERRSDGDTRAENEPKDNSDVG
jgi:hypothetical protein